MLNVAVLPESVAGLPSALAPSMNCTVPVAVPPPGATVATVAVSVVDWPEVDGLTLDATEVVVFATVTVCATPADTLAGSALVPPDPFPA